ncbi:hypothetical protein G6F35_018247 [Rhizopus arrhizus]|nr:hypothetical protein G6F35_018247 [Rhizopus arrhizus]
MQTMPVMISAASSVSACMLAMASGMIMAAPPASTCDAEITMYEILKPTPVKVTTPITIPTAPAAAPTASAYLAPAHQDAARDAGERRQIRRAAAGQHAYQQDQRDQGGPAHLERLLELGHFFGRQ